MEDWEDENVPDLLKKEQPKNNWDDEDLEDDDVKDSWEDDDDKPDVAPKAEPTPEKVPKKAAAKLDEKKGKVAETAKESLDPIEEKIRQQRLVEEADYKSTAELFAKKGDEKTLENFIPKSESDFSEYAELISHTLRPYEMPRKLRLRSQQLQMKKLKQKRKLMPAKRRQLGRRNSCTLAKQMMRWLLMVMMSSMTTILCE